MTDSQDSKMLSQNESVSLKYPVMLCHGFGVIVTLLQDSHLGKVRHYYQKKGILAFDPHVTPYAAIETRALEWKEKLLAILQETGAEKCHIVAHSMGGLDIRWLSKDPAISKLIASIHTVSSPHHGTHLVTIRTKFPDFLVKPVLKTANLLASKVHKEGIPDVDKALEQLSPGYIKSKFNDEFPLQNEIPFFSYAGVSGIGTDIPIDVTLKYFNSTIFKSEGRNDGFVSVDSAKWGTFVGEFPLAHQEQIGLGLKKSKIPEFYRLWDNVLEKIVEVE